MTPRHLTLIAVLSLTACTASAPVPPSAPPSPVPAPALRLVAFDSCKQLEDDLRAATLRTGSRGPGVVMRSEVNDSSAARSSTYSGTNVHERGVDEADQVKTDGRRIVTVGAGTLRVVDAGTRRETGRLDLGGRTGPADLLLAGDRALVLVRSPIARAAYRQGGAATAEMVLVDLAGPPRVLSRWTGDGSLVDARQTGTTARVVLRTAPKFTYRQPDRGGKAEWDAAYRKAVTAADVGAWLPAWTVTTGGTAQPGRVGCDRVSRPDEYTGTELLTVLTFDLAADRLDGGDPVSLLADGSTVYGTGTSLYVTGDNQWQRGGTFREQTRIYRFDIAGAGRPAYVAAATVPGRLINQYALSERDGHLRVATTAGAASAVRVLRQRDGTLAEVGKVDGLGKGEQIYSVRFVEDRGYVVTFRRTDPLYSLDLRDPARPAVTGELKITGFSSHLQPAGPGRLIGVGQEAGRDGRTEGLQVSLFDVSDPARPARLDRHQVPDASSSAEYDPHALLWWPATGLLVVPTSSPDTGPTGALALRVAGDRVEPLRTLRQPAVRVAGKEDVWQSGIERTLVVGDTLWTVSANGLQALDLSTLEQTGWLPA